MTVNHLGLVGRTVTWFPSPMVEAPGLEPAKRGFDPHGNYGCTGMAPS